MSARMDTPTRQEALIETHAARQRAVALLKQLEQAQAECQALVAADRRTDPVQTVTGKSSLQAAIEQTKRMIAVLDRAVDEVVAAGNAAPATPTEFSDAGADEPESAMDVIGRVWSRPGSGRGAENDAASTITIRREALSRVGGLRRTGG